MWGIGTVPVEDLRYGAIIGQDGKVKRYHNLGNLVFDNLSSRGIGYWHARCSERVWLLLGSAGSPRGG